MSQSSPSYTQVFLIGSHHYHYVYRELVNKQKRHRLSANVAKSVKQRILNEIHAIHVEISTESLMTPDFQQINEVCSS